jgi:hypothetical protein
MQKAAHEFRCPHTANSTETIMRGHVARWLVPFAVLVLAAAIFFAVRATVTSSTGSATTPQANARSPVTDRAHHAPLPSIPPATMTLQGQAGGGRARINCYMDQGIPELQFTAITKVTIGEMAITIWKNTRQIDRQNVLMAVHPRIIPAGQVKTYMAMSLYYVNWWVGGTMNCHPVSFTARGS